MVIFIMQNTPRTIRGELSRWMIEPKAGIFIGNLSAMVREKLWNRMQDTVTDGGAILIYSAQTEQGFAIKTFGDTSRFMDDYEGISLACIPQNHQNS